MNNEPEKNEVLRLPLWRNVLEQMQTEVVEHGKVYDASFFEDGLKSKRDTMAFGLGMAEIRRQLEKDGFYLSGRGQKGAQFIIVPAAVNQDVMRAYQRQAIDALSRGVILGTNTRLDLLNAEERRKHESILEKMATRAALMAHSGAIAKMVLKENPSLLNP